MEIYLVFICKLSTSEEALKETDMIYNIVCCSSSSSLPKTDGGFNVKEEVKSMSSGGDEDSFPAGLAVLSFCVPSQLVEILEKIEI